MKITLRAGEKVYINGAILCADRKVSLEFLNDVTFLLESHVLQADETTTPLRQLYYAAQIMLINPLIRHEASI
ncbi:TPA: flagellar biosynthesis repressor FlbT, partial [Escherichia coli]|nr:flagellar biosynthesis repressor FlbT [Escherichia coli]